MQANPGSGGPGTNGAPSTAATGGSQYLRQGITYDELGLQIADRIQSSFYIAGRHAGAALGWRSAAAPLAWLTAVFAAVSGLSLVASNDLLTQGLAIATAFIAATNAAVNPTDQARRHFAAQVAYRHVGIRLEDLRFFEVGDSHDAIPEGPLRSLRERIERFDEDIQALEESSPPLGSIFTWLRRG